MIKSLIKKIISTTGYGLYKINKRENIVQYDGNLMIAGLQRMKNIGIDPTLVVDVGAAQGKWSENLLGLWPAANYHLIEPLFENISHLDKLKKSHSNIKFHLAVAGEGEGNIELFVSDDLDGSGIYGIKGEKTRVVPMTSIDTIVKHEKDILIKLDTHGYEVPILKGAEKTLKNTILLVIEVYGFRISPSCLLFHEITAYLDNLGFRLIDLVDIMRRPGDQVFWQADAFYVRKEHPVFNKVSYA